MARKRPGDLAVFRHAGFFEQENILHGDLLAFEAHEFGDVRDLAASRR